jgi:hypothetical protein
LAPVPKSLIVWLAFRLWRWTRMLGSPNNANVAIFSPPTKPTWPEGETWVRAELGFTKSSYPFCCLL